MTTTITNTTKTAIYLDERSYRVPRGFRVGAHVSSPGRAYKYVIRNRDDVAVLCPLTPAEDELMTRADMRAALHAAWALSEVNWQEIAEHYIKDAKEGAV